MSVAVHVYLYQITSNIEVKVKLFLLSGKSRNSFYLLHIKIKTNVAYSGKR